MAGKQAVVATTAGTFVIDLRPDLAPNHVGYFIKLAKAGAYDGTIFHRVVRLGIIQGGDPLSKDAAKTKLYGTGGLGVLKAEISSEKHTRGAVSAVLQPGKPDSAGSQFFVSVTNQPALDGQYTILGRVSEGIDVVQKISEAAADERGAPAERIEIRSVAIRDTPPPEPEPFATESPAELAKHRAILETSAGPITVEFFADKAPEHVRNFLRLASLGVFDGTLVPSRRPRIRHPDWRGDVSRASQREAAEDGPLSSAGVQRHQAREGHPVHGPRRRPGECHDVVFHRHRGCPVARREVHCVWPRRRRYARGRGDRADAGQRRGAGHAGRPQVRPNSELATAGSRKRTGTPRAASKSRECI